MATIDQLCEACELNVADWLEDIAFDFRNGSYQSPESFTLVCNVDGMNTFVLGIPVDPSKPQED